MSAKQYTESQRVAASRLSRELGLHIIRNQVVRLRERGIDTDDTAAVALALSNQQIAPTPLTTARPSAKSPPPSAPPTDGEQVEPLSPEALSQRLTELQAELLAAPCYQSGRAVFVKIKGFEALVKVQQARGDLVDRKQVEGEAYQFGNLVKTMVLQLPARLIPMIVGLDYPEAFEKAEEWVYTFLQEVYESSREHVCPVTECAVPQPINQPASAEDETEP